MTLVQKNLRSNILGRSTNSICALSDCFGEAVIDQLKVAIISDHDVFWLKITVADVMTVKVLENRSDLGTIKST